MQWRSVDQPLQDTWNIRNIIRLEDVHVKWIWLYLLFLVYTNSLEQLDFYFLPTCENFIITDLESLATNNTDVTLSLCTLNSDRSVNRLKLRTIICR